MIGDKILIHQFHTDVAEKIVNKIYKKILQNKSNDEKYVISVAGESGSGKSEIGFELSRLLNIKSIQTAVLGQDDYFVFPPLTNRKMRLNNPEQVGLYEVKLDLIDANLFSFKSGADKIYKPLVDYNKDTILHEIRDIGSLDVIVIEGTYTSLLTYVDCRVFIDRNYKETRGHREDRNRGDTDPYTEEILAKEHEIISAHKKMANIIIKQDYSGITREVL
jgi:uridine kinase